MGRCYRDPRDVLDRQKRYDKLMKQLAEDWLCSSNRQAPRISPGSLPKRQVSFPGENGTGREVMPRP